MALSTLVMVGISAALAVASYFLMQPKTTNAKKQIDFTPTTLASQGSYVPLLVGRRRIGYVFGWSGDRYTYQDTSGQPRSGKGFGGGKKKAQGTTTYVETGWHQLAVGPASFLRTIWADGKVWWSGQIDNVGTPSGSTITVSSRESFTIYWGEPGQPVNTYLGGAGRVDANSRWPHLCYVVITKVLGPSPHWPQIEYDLEVYARQDFYSTDEQTAFDMGGGHNLSYGSYTSPTYAGVNPMFALSQLLHDTYPHGMGFDRGFFDYVTSGDPTGTTWWACAAALWDTGSGSSERLVTSQLVADAEFGGNVAATLMQDLGLFLYRLDSGIYGFRLLRYEATPRAVPSDAVELPDVAIESIFFDTPADRMLFSFPDVARNFRETVISIDDDGQPFRTGNVRGTTVQMTTVVDWPVATKLANRRVQEAITHNVKYQIKVKSPRQQFVFFAPGDVVRITGVQQTLRLLEVKDESLSPEQTWSAIEDHYGAAALTVYPPVPPSIAPDVVAPAANLAADFFEVPAYMQAAGVEAIAPVRIRAHTQIATEAVHLSLDGSTYEEVDTDVGVQSGGALTSNMDATGWVIAQGPTFDVLGADLLTVAQDLSGDHPSWRQGKQGCLIGDELFFLQKVTALGGSSFRLDGLIRARYDTQRAAHSIGDKVYVFRLSDLEPTIDSRIAPGATLYAKQQPVASSALSLGSVTATSKTLIGKGLVPMLPCALRVTAPVLGAAAWGTGQDITFAWAYRSTEKPRTGAGLQPAGMASAVSAIRGTFELRLLTTGDALQHTVTGLSSPAYTLANADLVTWFGSEPSAFHVQLYNVDGGLRSPALTLTVTKV